MSVLKTYIAKHSLTYPGLAKRIEGKTGRKVSPVTLLQITQDLRCGSPRMLRDIATTINVPLDTLLFRKLHPRKKKGESRTKRTSPNGATVKRGLAHSK